MNQNTVKITLLKSSVPWKTEKMAWFLSLIIHLLRLSIKTPYNYHLIYLIPKLHVFPAP